MEKERDHDDGTIHKARATEMVLAWQTGKFHFKPSIKSDLTNRSLDAGMVEAESGAMPLNAFLFSMHEYVNFVNRMLLHNQQADEANQVNGVICWMGIKEVQDPATGNLRLQPAMIFEGLVGFDNSDPNNVIAGTPIGQMDPVLHPDAGLTARYDFSYPCPPTCAPIKEI